MEHGLVCLYLKGLSIQRVTNSEINANEELSKFKDSVIEEFEALKSSFLAEVDSFKKRHLNFCGYAVSVENSERLIKQLQEDITFLREQLKNKDDVIHSLLQPVSETW